MSGTTVNGAAPTVNPLGSLATESSSGYIPMTSSNSTIPNRPANTPAASAPVTPTQQQATTPPSNPISVTSNNSTSSNTTNNSQSSAFQGWPTSPNILNSAIQQSYIIRFFCAGDTGAAASPYPTASSLSNAISIAESGRTGSINLTDLKIAQYINSNNQSRNMDAATLTFKLVEPMGSTLMDLMLRAAGYFGIKNFTKSPWFLGIKFIGQLNTGSGGYWNALTDEFIYRITITSFHAELNAGGCVYTIGAAIFDNHAALDHIAQLHDNFTYTANSTSKPVPISGQGSATGVSSNNPNTIGAVLNAVMDSQNIAAVNAAKPTGGKPQLQYEIKFMNFPEPLPSGNFKNFGEIPIVPKSLDTSSTNPQGQITFPSGIDIGRIIDILSTAYWNSAQGNTQTVSVSVQPDNTQKNSLPLYIYRIATETKILDYNDKLQDYNKLITYIIVPFRNFRGIANIPSLDKDASDKLISDSAKDVLAKNRCTKLYNYLFTGQNVDVINLNFDFDFTWFFTNPQLPSVGYNTTAVNTSVSTDARTATGQPSQGNSGASSQITQQQPITTGGSGSFKYAEQLPVANSIKLLASASNIGPNPSKDFNRNTQQIPDASRSIMSTILNQVHSEIDNNLLNIELLIRGDPYWFGSPTPFSSGSFTPSTPNLPNFKDGEYMFMLQFNFPQGIDPNTGMLKLSPIDMYSGFYTVIQIDHIFESGTFKQCLHGVRNIGWDITTLNGQSPPSSSGTAGQPPSATSTTPAPTPTPAPATPATPATPARGQNIISSNTPGNSPTFSGTGANGIFPGTVQPTNTIL